MNTLKTEFFHDVITPVSFLVSPVSIAHHRPIPSFCGIGMAVDTTIFPEVHLHGSVLSVLRVADRLKPLASSSGRRSGPGRGPKCAAGHGVADSIR